MSTDKNIKDYLPFYLGVDVYDFHNKKTGVLFGINRSGINNVKILHGEDVWNVRYTSVKPILRPLSDITWEERDGAVLLHRLNKWGEQTMESMAAITQYLLSKHFDLFGLIEAGLAIDKTKNL